MRVRQARRAGHPGTPRSGARAAPDLGVAQALPDPYPVVGDVGECPGVEKSRRSVVGILLFDDDEVLDFAGPHEVCGATLDPSREPYVDVITVGTGPLITCSGGLRVQPDDEVAECPPLDALIVPGGPGAEDRRPVRDQLALPFPRAPAGSTPTVASVCTGAFLQGRAGLVEHQADARTHTGRGQALRAVDSDRRPATDVRGRRPSSAARPTGVPRSGADRGRASDRITSQTEARRGARA